MTRRAPTFILRGIVDLRLISLGTVKLIMTAGTSQFTAAGMKRAKNSPNWTLPFCQTINVVMSPKGEKAPPALAATTMLTQETTTNLLLLRAMVMTTAPIRRAVVRLSHTGERKNDSVPVIQYIVFRPNPLFMSHVVRASKTFLSSSAFMYVIATRRKRKSSTYSARLPMMA